MLDAVRLLVLGVFLLSVAVLITHRAVKARRLSPFGAWPRFIRWLSDPVMKPLERRLVRSGRNPVDAPLWLAGITLLGGLVLISFLGWFGGAWWRVRHALEAGPEATATGLVDGAITLLSAAVVIRAVASWFGIGRFTRWMRPVYALTDWIILPIQRIIPPLGPVDISPIVAWFLLMILRAVIMRVV